MEIRNLGIQKIATMKCLNVKFSLFFALTAIFASGCFIVTDRGKFDLKILKIVNNSKESISVLRSFSYPDTAASKATACGCTHVASNSSCECFSANGWRYDIGQNSHAIGMIFVLSDSTMKILKRIEYTIVDYDSAKWTIVYP